MKKSVDFKTSKMRVPLYDQIWIKNPFLFVKVVKNEPVKKIKFISHVNSVKLSAECLNRVNFFFILLSGLFLIDLKITKIIIIIRLYEDIADIMKSETITLRRISSI